MLLPIKNEITFDNMNFIFSHEEFNSNYKTNDKTELYVKDKISENNILTKIIITENSKIIKTIVLHWIFFQVNNFGLSYINETKILFLGAGKLSITIDLNKFKIINENYNDCMFWGFEKYKKYIIEYGELNCYLYNINGILLDECPVDPPYEIEKYDDKIKFISSNYGEQYLKFK